MKETNERLLSIRRSIEKALPSLHLHRRDVLAGFFLEIVSQALKRRSKRNLTLAVPAQRH